MKKSILSAIIGAVCTLLVLYCIAAIRSPQAAEGYEHIDFVSDLSREDCFLCSSDTRHWGEDNVGILNLNTFGLLCIEINRYDDRRQLITEPAGCMHVNSMQNVTSSATPDRGYAHVQITNIQYTIDKSVIQSKLCQTCLDTVNSLSFFGSARRSMLL